jgi:hypothetical protein
LHWDDHLCAEALEPLTEMVGVVGFATVMSATLLGIRMKANRFTFALAKARILLMRRPRERPIAALEIFSRSKALE